MDKDVESELCSNSQKITEKIPWPVGCVYHKTTSRDSDELSCFYAHEPRKEIFQLVLDAARRSGQGRKTLPYPIAYGQEGSDVLWTRLQSW
ncbi:MAG: hypothetical protein LUE14_03215 [Clostridiales bacterium]|nr:hypothetical protein [Clostridiales bacterium]